MTLMVSNKNEYVEALRNAPYQWQYTPVRLKRPYINKWQDNPLSLDDAAAKDGTGIGLILGELTETVAIDFDGEGTEENFQNYFGHSVDDLPESICWSSGRPHRHQRAYLVPREWWPLVTHIQKDAAIPNIEIRWNDHQSVVVGKHPNTEGDGSGRYDFLPKYSPDEQTISMAPPWFCKKWAELSAAKIAPPQLEENRDELLHDSSRVKRYLFELLQPPNAFKDHDTWLDVGMALHHVSKGLGDTSKHYRDWVEWSSYMDTFEEAECLRRWSSFGQPKGKPKTFGTIVKIHQDALSKNKIEAPKRKRSQLLKDLLKHAKSKNLDDYFEDFAEMETRFRRRPELITTDLLNELRNEYSNFRSFTVGPVDMEQVKDLEYLLEGYLIRGENHQFYGGAGSGKTSLLAGMIKAGFHGKGFLDQTRHRERFRTLWVACDGSTSRFKASYKAVGLNPEMVDVWGGDTKQGKTTFKFTIPDLILLREKLKDKQKNYGLCVFDSVKGMLTNSGFKYQDNEHADLICQYLREIFAEPLEIATVLINHLAADGVNGSGAKRWGEVVAQNIEVQPVKESGKENHQLRKLCIWKDPINGRKIFDYGFEDGFFKPAFSTDMQADCYSTMKKFVQDWNVRDGKRIFSRKDLLTIPNFSRAQVDRIAKEHLQKGGIFKTAKDSSGKVIAAKYQLRKDFALNSTCAEENPLQMFRAACKKWE